MSIKLPQDNIFYVEVALGVITAVRGMIMRDLFVISKQSVDKVKLQNIEQALVMINHANEQVYLGKVQPVFLTCLVNFLKGDHDYTRLNHAVEHLVN